MPVANSACSRPPVRCVATCCRCCWPRFTRLAHSDAEILTFTRGLGAITAALLWGVVRAGAVAGWRGGWLACRCCRWAAACCLGAVGWLLWRDYFNFPLTDFPALLLLATGLWALLRGRSGGSGVAGGRGRSGGYYPAAGVSWPHCRRWVCWRMWPLSEAELSACGIQSLPPSLGTAGRCLVLGTWHLVLAPQFYMNANRLSAPIPPLCWVGRKTAPIFTSAN